MLTCCTNHLLQKYKLYFVILLSKLINRNGSPELIFIGISEQKERYTEGLMLSVPVALTVVVVKLKLILEKVSSLCSDGTILNTGEKRSLWALMGMEIKSAGSFGGSFLLLKIWCADHYFINLNNLKLIVFLGDVLFSFQRFQKNTVEPNGYA